MASLRSFPAAMATAHTWLWTSIRPVCAVAGEEIGLRDVTAAGRVLVGAVTEVGTPDVTVFPVSDIVKAGEVEPTLEIPGLGDTEGKVGTATGGRGIVVDAACGVAELRR